jgi:deoxyribodipyrimidine photo-lyase
MSEINIVWLRRDLRLNDNAALYAALKSGLPVLPLFIFDTDILDHLKDKSDLRVQFIHRTLAEIKFQLNSMGSDLLVHDGKPKEVWEKLLKDFKIKNVFFNNDYEPYARKRDRDIENLLTKNQIGVFHYKDQVLFEKEEVLTGTKSPYTVFTPYKKKVLSKLRQDQLMPYPTERYFKSFLKVEKPEKMPSLKDIGFTATDFSYPSAEVSISAISRYESTRNFPAIENGTSKLGVHLRFGTVSVRHLARIAIAKSPTWLSELIWRDFFFQILWHFPHVEKEAFHPQYDNIKWRDSKSDFEKWREGKTGYPLVDAGMRELKATGYMHNRVRMVAASFLVKHLLIDWRKGEKYFAEKLLDFDLASNNGNWQWVAGSGCDAAPYFRVFNPQTQIKKFDPDYVYIKKWIPEYDTSAYPEPMIDHAEARQRVLHEYAKALGRI